MIPQMELASKQQEVDELVLIHLFVTSRILSQLATSRLPSQLPSASSEQQRCVPCLPHSTCA
jgi:hypothetical protein